MMGASESSEGSESQDEDEEEEEHRGMYGARTRRSQRPRKPIRAGDKRTKATKKTHQSPHHEQTVLEMETEDQDLIAYINSKTRVTEASKLLKVYNRQKKYETLSDSALFMEQLKVILPADDRQPPSLFLNVSKASPDMRQRLTKIASTYLKLYPGTYCVDNIRVVSDNAVNYRRFHGDHRRHERL